MRYLKSKLFASKKDNIEFNTYTKPDNALENIFRPGGGKIIRESKK